MTLIGILKKTRDILNICILKMTDGHVVTVGIYTVYVLYILIKENIGQLLTQKYTEYSLPLGLV